MSLRYAVLGLLSEGPGSGYDLMKLFEISLANVWPATQSQLYGELGRLADAGLIEVVAEGPRGRKEYALTESGQTEMRHWLTEVEPQRLRRSNMLLRVFFLGMVDSAEARAYLVRQGISAAEEHDRLDLIRPIADGDDRFSVYGRLALEWGLRFNAMQRDWAEWAVHEIETATGDGHAPEAGASGAVGEDPETSRETIESAREATADGGEAIGDGPEESETGREALEDGHEALQTVREAPEIVPEAPEDGPMASGTSENGRKAPEAGKAAAGG